MRAWRVMPGPRSGRTSTGSAGRPAPPGSDGRSGPPRHEATPSGSSAARAATLLAATFLAAVSVLAAAPSADARSVTDPDIGWPTALRKELHLPKVAAAHACTKRTTKAMIRLQSRLDRRDPGDHLRGLLHYATNSDVWGSLWYDPCDGGRLEVGVASGGTARDTRTALRRARAFVREQHQTRDVRFVAVRSTNRQLYDASDAFGTAFSDLFDTTDLESGIDTSRNALDIDVPGGLPDAARARLHAFAASSPVNVLLHFEPAPELVGATVDF